MSFENRLVSLRKDNNLTQRELAKKINISRGALSLYELGTRKPDFDTLERIASFFNVSVDYLLGRTENSKPINQIVADSLSNDPELLSFWNELKEREDLQLLFKQTKDLSPNAIKRIIRIIKAIEVEEALED